MIYMEPHMLGWRPVLLSWINDLPETITEAQKEYLIELFDHNVPPAIQFVRKGGYKVSFQYAKNWPALVYTVLSNIFS